MDAAEIIEAMAAEIVALKQRVAALEARQGRSLPGDYRFVSRPDGSIEIRRVSTGDGETITGPL